MCNRIQQLQLNEFCVFCPLKLFTHVNLISLSWVCFVSADIVKKKGNSIRMLDFFDYICKKMNTLSVQGW